MKDEMSYLGETKTKKPIAKKLKKQTKHCSYLYGVDGKHDAVLGDSGQGPRRHRDPQRRGLRQGLIVVRVGHASGAGATSR